MLRGEILKIWAHRNAISCILSNFQATFIAYLKTKWKINIQTIFEINFAVYLMEILTDFRETVETGMDPDNNGEIEMIIAIKNGGLTLQ